MSHTTRQARICEPCATGERKHIKLLVFVPWTWDSLTTHMVASYSVHPFNRHIHNWYSSLTIASCMVRMQSVGPMHRNHTTRTCACDQQFASEYDWGDIWETATAWKKSRHLTTSDFIRTVVTGAKSVSWCVQLSNCPYWVNISGVVLLDLPTCLVAGNFASGWLKFNLGWLIYGHSSNTFQTNRSLRGTLTLLGQLTKKLASSPAFIAKPVCY